MNKPLAITKSEQHRKTFTAYLEKYAEPEARQVVNITFEQRYQHFLVVPCYAETSDFLEKFLPLCHANQCLLIVVINQPTSIKQCEQNHSLWQACIQSYEQTSRQGNLVLCNNSSKGDLLLVDRFGPGLTINDKQGVGLARKIGCDIATALINIEHVQKQQSHNMWIHTTDADATLPPDYFSRSQHLSGESAALYPFTHQGKNDDVDKATQLYQQALHYYVDGLRWAGSPYAFHTVGSCLAVSAKHYCQVRGFPKRSGGEDFYLLNKLAKIAPIVNLSGQAIIIQSRRSNRAPFGTGPAIEKMLALNDLTDYCSYNPQIFVELKRLLEHLQSWWSKHHDATSDHNWFDDLPQASQSTCQQLGFQQLFVHLRKQCHSEHDARVHIHHWFDGFRTLKFIHLLQANSYPPVPLQEALTTAKQLFSSP